MDSVCDDLARLDATVPFIAMTYYNIVLHYGLDRCAGKFSASGIRGAIVPDLALEETGPWIEACDGADVATVLLVAPSTPPERVDDWRGHARVSPTPRHGWPSPGKSEGGGDGERVVRAIRRTSDVPALIGIGIASARSGPQAAARERRRHRRFGVGAGDPRRRRRARR